jgi:hypothetical protein
MSEPTSGTFTGHSIAGLASRTRRDATELMQMANPDLADLVLEDAAVEVAQAMVRLATTEQSNPRLQFDAQKYILDRVLGAPVRGTERDPRARDASGRSRDPLERLLGAVMEPVSEHTTR